MIRFGSVKTVSKFVRKRGNLSLISKVIAMAVLMRLLVLFYSIWTIKIVSEIKCSKYDSFPNESLLLGFTRLRNLRALREI